jgi:hypothetical protein
MLNRGDLAELSMVDLNTKISSTVEKTHSRDPRSTEDPEAHPSQHFSQIKIIEGYCLPVHVEFVGGPAIVVCIAPSSGVEAPAWHGGALIVPDLSALHRLRAAGNACSMSGERLSVLIVAANASARWAGEAILPLHIFRGLLKAGHDAWMCVGNETVPRALRRTAE